MSKRLLSLLSVLFFSALLSLPAYDFGGTFDNATTLDTAPLVLQEDKLALWFQTPLGRFLTLAVQGSFTYTYDSLSNSPHSVLLDVDSLKIAGDFPLQGTRPSLFTFTVGRFPLADFSRQVLDTTIDGMELRWRGARLNATLAAAFTGLELEPASSVNMTWADINSTSAFAPPRVVEMLELHFPELFLRQDLLVAVLAQQDLRSQDQPGIQPEGPAPEVVGRGGLLSTEYLGLSLRGPLSGSLYYDVFAYLGTGRTLSYIEATSTYSYEWLVSALTGGGLRYFREQWLNSRVELRFLLATGDTDYTVQFTEGNRDGLAATFVPITPAELALVFSPKAGNLALLSLSYSIKPIEILQTGLTAAVFVRPTLGLISDSQVDKTSDSRYLGSEIDATAKLRPWSDLGMALSLGIFLPGGAFPAGERDSRFRGRLEISLSF
jgi:hypothetical protein